MSAQLLETQFRVNYYALQTNLAGFTREDGLLQPAPAGNCANWILGHLLGSRNQIHELVGLPPAWDEARAARYRRGSPPVLREDDGAPFDELMGHMKRSQEVLVPALAALTPQTLERALSGGSTVGRELALLSFHEAYHVGQTGLLRRLAGKQGAIV